jgi:hypothetical protein
MDPNQQPVQQPQAQRAAPAVAQAAPVFALVPGDVPGVIDYSSRQGLAIFSQASRSLYEDPADLFNVESAGLQTFLALLSLRGITTGWDMDIPLDLTQPLNDLTDLITNHGIFPLEHLRDFAATYVTNQSRASQMNLQMVKCILASISLPGFCKIQTWHADWYIGQLPVAILLIKVIIRESYIDTQATTRILRGHLSSLPEKIHDLKDDIDQLNAFVKVTQDQLNARGETTHDLLANLFKGYLACKDSTFHHYIEKKQEDYDDGATFTVDGLMSLASNKFKILTEQGKWMAPTDEQAKIIALETKMGKMGKAPQKTSNNQKSNSTNSSTGNNNRKSNNQQGKSTKKQSGKKTLPAWMTKWPGQAFVDSNQSKTVEGKKYWWCKHHKCFVQHQSNECKNKPSNSGNNNSSSTAASSNNNTVPSIRVTAATLMDE